MSGLVETFCERFADVRVVYFSKRAQRPAMIDVTPKDTPERRDYLSYLLRLWRVGKEEAVWRASLESPHGGERIGFASLDALFAFLQQQTNDNTEEER